MMFNVANAVDDLRQLVAKADALAHAAENLFDQVIWVEDGDDRRRLERLAHLVGATAEAVQAAAEAGDELAVELANHRVEA
jgi:ABC-type transporter Mla subunit MlaD